MDLTKLSKEELITRYSELQIEEEQLTAEKSEIRAILLEKLNGDGEIIGHYSVSKAKRYLFKVALDKARELGAIKEAVDQTILKKLYFKGVGFSEGEVTVSEYPVIREVIKE